MRDLALLAFLVISVGFSFWRPWLGVLALTLVGYMSPHAYAWGFMRHFPIYQILFISVFIAFVNEKQKQSIPKDWRVTVFFLLWLYFFVTTTLAMVPFFAWEKFLFVSKVYIPLIFTLLLIDNRIKLDYLILTIALAFGLPAIKGGIFAIATAFNYRVYGPPKSFYGGNNEFAIATLIVIPLFVFLFRRYHNKWIRMSVSIAIPLCFASALSSYSRGALLTAVALILTLIWDSKRKILVLPLFALGIYVAAGHLPEQWFDRMHTIETYEEDKSALGRLEVWRDGFNYALEHPFRGAGFEGWKYVSMRDWHSSYIEILAEHGVIAFAMWLALLAGTMVSLSRLTKKVKKYVEMSWVRDYSRMLRASLVSYSVGSLFLGLSYWDIFYHIIFISILVKKFALEEYENREKMEQTATHNPVISVFASGLAQHRI